jgi:YVTN family beta-propeller protein
MTAARTAPRLDTALARTHTPRLEGALGPVIRSHFPSGGSPCVSPMVTLTPDGKTAYVANPVTNDVSVVDIASMKETTRIPVGFVPKRNVTVSLQ